MSLSSGSYTMVLESPLGHLGVLLDGDVVVRLDYLTRKVRLKVPRTRAAQRVARELANFFRDGGSRFSLDVRTEGTPFQRRVWGALRAIPAGETRTYGQLAGQLGSGPRAVGNACRRNPVSIIVPCHRVVAAKGMGGYSGKTADRAIWRAEGRRWVREGKLPQPGWWPLEQGHTR